LTSARCGLATPFGFCEGLSSMRAAAAGVVLGALLTGVAGSASAIGSFFGLGKSEKTPPKRADETPAPTTTSTSSEVLRGSKATTVSWRARVPYWCDGGCPAHIRRATLPGTTNGETGLCRVPKRRRMIDRSDRGLTPRVHNGLRMMASVPVGVKRK